MTSSSAGRASPSRKRGLGWPLAAAVCLVVSIAVWVVSTDRVPTTTGTGERRSVLHRLSADSLFDSSIHPDPAVSEIASISAAYFLASGGVVIVSRYDMQFVELSSGRSRTVGGRGQGPGELQIIMGTVRTADGIAVWDMLSRQISLFSGKGDFIRSRSYNPLNFRNMMANPVAIQSDGAILFRDQEDTRASGLGRTWDPVRYVRVRPGEAEVVLEYEGEEQFYHRSGPDVIEPYDVVFGHTTLEGHADDRLVVASTVRDSIDILDLAGQLAFRIPLPERIAASASQLEAGLALVTEKRNRLAANAVRALRREGVNAEFGPAVNVPSNDRAPAIDRLFTDADGRLWIRHYHFPDQDSVRWQVWSIDEVPQLEFELLVGSGDELRDAQGDRLLLRREDDLGVARVVIRETRSPTQPQ